MMWMTTRAGRSVALGAVLALGAGFLVVTPAAAEPSDGPPEVSRLIVAYEPGVAAVRPDGEATGSGTVPGVELSPGDPLGAGMRTVELEGPVSEATAEQIAARLARDPRIAWAEPDRFIELAEDLPVRDPNEPLPVKDADSLQQITTACTESSMVEPIARCFDDDNLDAGWSVDAEIIWADAYVTSADPSRMIIDIVPYFAIDDRNWLLYSDVSISTEFDVDGDDVADLSLRPVPAALDAGQSTSITVWERIVLTKYIQHDIPHNHRTSSMLYHTFLNQEIKGSLRWAPMNIRQPIDLYSYGLFGH
jgi:hypothetical protein